MNISSSDDNIISNNHNNNPLLSDPIQLSLPKLFENNTKGTIGEIGKRLSEIKPIHIATLILFLSGIFQVFFNEKLYLNYLLNLFKVFMGIFRLDFLSCYFSEQVMSGFVLGGCVHGKYFNEFIKIHYCII